MALHGCREPGVVRWLASNLMNDNEFSPKIHDGSLVTEQTKDATQESQSIVCVRRTHSDTVQVNGARRNNPELEHVLRHDDKFVGSTAQNLGCPVADVVVRVCGFHEAQKYIRIRKNLHQS